MRKNMVLSMLEKKDADAEHIAQKVIERSELLPELLSGVSSANPRVRFGSAKVLRTISEHHPKLLYSRMGFFVDLLDSHNNILKWNAIDIIAKLTMVDSRNKFNRLFKKFYSHLYDGSLITAGHIVGNSGKIALYKPELRDKITNELLKVEEVPLPTSECRQILIGHAINAFQLYYNQIKNKDKAVSFVKRQLKSSRHATRTKAERFLEGFSKP